MSGKMRINGVTILNLDENWIELLKPNGNFYEVTFRWVEDAIGLREYRGNGEWFKLIQKDIDYLIDLAKDGVFYELTF